MVVVGGMGGGRSPVRGPSIGGKGGVGGGQLDVCYLAFLLQLSFICLAIRLCSSPTPLFNPLLPPLHRLRPVSRITCEPSSTDIQTSVHPPPPPGSFPGSRACPDGGTAGQPAEEHGGVAEAASTFGRGGGGGAGEGRGEGGKGTAGAGGHGGVSGSRGS